MYKDSYHKLAYALDQLPSGFPKTESSVEIEILKRLYKPEEAELVSDLSRNMELSTDIARRANINEAEAEQMLSDLAKRDVIWSTANEGKRLFRLAPWIIGLYEAQVDTMDHSFAHLVEDYSNKVAQRDS